MVPAGEKCCPCCGGALRSYDKVQRMLRTKGGKKTNLWLRRLRCTRCGKLHRELPIDILPYRRYERELILGVVEGLITPDTLGFEDYPCELTMKRWRASQKLQGLK